MHECTIHGRKVKCCSLKKKKNMILKHRCAKCRIQMGTMGLEKWKQYYLKLTIATSRQVSIWLYKWPITWGFRLSHLPGKKKKKKNSKSKSYLIISFQTCTPHLTYFNLFFVGLTWASNKVVYILLLIFFFNIFSIK